MDNPQFTISQIKARASYGDDYRAKHSMPYADSDINHLLKLIEGLTDLLERSSQELLSETREHIKELSEELIAKVRM